jgi:hypothetical protein
MREVVRDYSLHDAPAASQFIQASPLKIGESFEDLKRKMVPYRLNSQSLSNKHLPSISLEALPSITAAATPVTGIAIDENDDLGAQEELIVSPARRTRSGEHEDILGELSATPILKVRGRELDGLASDAKCFPLASDFPAPMKSSSGLSTRYGYDRVDENDDAQRLAVNVGTPLALRAAVLSTTIEMMPNAHEHLLYLPGIADEKDDGHDDVFNDKLSESNDVLEDTAAESTSQLFALNHFDWDGAGALKHQQQLQNPHAVAVDMVENIFYRAMQHPASLVQQ